MSNPALPSYVSMAKPNPPTNRAPWHKNTAPTYAGIFLWFVFWMGATGAPNAGGVLSHGVWAPIISLALAALLCHTFYYVVLGIMGQKTGLPLYILGTSTFGTQGGFILPGFLMGVLQFGWLGVNIYASSMAINKVVPIPATIIMVIWGVLAAFMGLKGIQYIARVATYLPLIPLAALVIMLLATVGGIGSFNSTDFVKQQVATGSATAAPFTSFGLVAFVLTYVIGFFATAGAAGAAGKMATDAFSLIPVVLGSGFGTVLQLLLAIAAFPAACFSAFIAANSFKTTLSTVNPFVSVGIGTAVSIILAISGKAGALVPVFTIIGASFGPICGAMAVDYVMNGCKWAGPRPGFNPAGWLGWGFGFVVGIMPNLGVPLPLAPLWALVVGAVVYLIVAKAGMQPAAEMPAVWGLPAPVKTEAPKGAVAPA
jgi:cytosine permease